jgi:hypothetical protein
MPQYTPSPPPPDRTVTADRTPLLRPWRSPSPASVHLVEQIALFWLEDDRRELARVVPAARRVPAGLLEDDPFED